LSIVVSVETKATSEPTLAPVAPETAKPTKKPTSAPSTAPETAKPTKKPTSPPSTAPETAKPTKKPTSAPSKAPETAKPTKKPTAAPVAPETAKPTKKPTPAPSKAPMTTQVPTESTTMTAALRGSMEPSVVMDDDMLTEGPTFSQSQSETNSPSPTIATTTATTNSPTEEIAVKPTKEVILPKDAMTIRLSSNQDGGTYSLQGHRKTCAWDSCGESDSAPTGNDTLPIKGCTCVNGYDSCVVEGPPIDSYVFDEATLLPVLEESEEIWKLESMGEVLNLGEGGDCLSGGQCGQHMLRGGFRVDLTDTGYVFHDSSYVSVHGWSPEMELRADGKLVEIVYSQAQDAAIVIAVPEGARAIQVVCGGLCGSCSSNLYVKAEEKSANATKTTDAAEDLDIYEENHEDGSDPWFDQRNGTMCTLCAVSMGVPEAYQSKMIGVGEVATSCGNLADKFMYTQDTDCDKVYESFQDILGVDDLGTPCGCYDMECQLCPNGEAALAPDKVIPDLAIDGDLPVTCKTLEGMISYMGLDKDQCDSYFSYFADHGFADPWTYCECPTKPLGTTASTETNK